jgi:hypothetical protein
MFGFPPRFVGGQRRRRGDRAKQQSKVWRIGFAESVTLHEDSALGP